MDIARQRPLAVRIAPRIVTAGVALALIGAGTWGALSLRTGTAPAYVMDRASVVTDTVRAGPFIRSVAASGTISARHIAIVSVPAEGTVNAVFVHPGSPVSAGTPIAQLANPAINADIADLGAQIAAARADLASVRQQAITAQLERRQAVRATEAERSEDQDAAVTQAALHTQGFIGDNAYRGTLTKLAEAVDRETLQRAELASIGADGNAKIASAQARITQLRGQLARKLAERDTLTVRAGTDGVVQSVTAQLGAHELVGSEAARIADRNDLEAALAVAEGDARSVVPGLGVTLTTASGTARGSVLRVDPAATAGTVRIEAALVRVPAGVRIDEHVDAQIELERVPHAISLARPAGVSDQSTTFLYKLVDARHAERVAVTLGRASSDRIIVTTGLRPGDVAIISDMSAATDHPLVTFK